MQRNHLSEALVNILQNAREAMNGNGLIEITASTGDEEEVLVSIKDHGPGIPPEIQKRIFDPFFSTKSDGTGLGLAIASEIVDKHRGSLEFDTESGKGTVFRILLPAGRNGQPNEQSAAD